MDLYCGNFICLFSLILALLAAPGQLEKTTRTAIQGGEASLECQTKSERCFEWRYSNRKLHGSLRLLYRDGNVLNNSNGKYSITAESSSGKCVLAIKNVSAEDSGTYICRDKSEELLKAEFIVFDKYPSELFCSINVRQHEPLLGSNICKLPPDSVEATCAMRFRDNSDLQPLLEWSIDGRSIQAIESKSDDGSTVSRVHISAIGLRSSSLLVCRVKYGINNDIQSNLSWSKRLDVTSLRHTSDLTEVSCDQKIVNCSEMGNSTHSYFWVNGSNIKMSEKTQLDLNGKPTGIYSCVVTHWVRNTWCSYSVKRINFTCDDTQKSESDASRGSEPDKQLKSHTSVVVVVVVIVIVVIGVSVGMAWMKFRKTRNRRQKENNKEGTNEHLTEDANI